MINLDGSDAGVGEIAGWAKAWLFANLHIWTTRGRHAAGLFAESLLPDGGASGADRRLFVQARHIFSICEAARLGWDGPAKELVSRAIDHLTGNGLRADGLYIHSFSNACEPTAAPADLYDQAFMLLALAHASNLLERSDLLSEAERLVEALDEQWLRKDGTYREGDTADEGLRLQNPHMHLFEAFLALHRASGFPEWKRRAFHMAGLCEQRFMDESSGAIIEEFLHDWNPNGTRSAAVVEPGHCFEWAWLFEKAAELGYDGIGTSDRLIAFARQFGIDPELGVAIGQVTVNGEVKHWQTRLWPQTERLKAATARYCRTRDPHELQEIASAFMGLRKFLDVGVPGTWRDKLRQDNSFVDENAPGSSLYHVVCCFAEIIDAEI